MSSPSSSLSLKVHFSGGLELLFSNQRDHDVTLPSIILEGNGKEGPVDIKYLIRWLKENQLKDRPELFTEGDTV
jgi:ubiquitin related modifier 1